MKATDLMLGDWVGYIGAYEDESGEIVKLWQRPISIKVTFITPDAVQYEDEEGCYECMDYELYPIPLTAEILEKNGFVSDNFSPYYLPIEDGSIRFSEHQYGLYCNLLRSYQRYDGVCNFVHQLQHALRLCGIEKEIII